MHRVVSTFFTLTLLAITATPALADGRRPGTSTLAEIVIASPDHTVLEFALDAAGLTGALDDPHSRLTLFAPTDGAFAKAASELGFASVTDLAEYLVDEELLDDVLLFHVTEGRRFSERLFGRRSAKAIPTLISQYLVSIPGLRIVDGTIATSDARVTQANLSARNGVLHVIDNVLVP